MKALPSIMTAIVIAGAALGWTSASAWWGNDHDDYYYDRPWRGGPWYGGYGPNGWGGGPYGWGGGPYGWGGGPYGWGGGGPYGWGGYGGSPQVIQIIRKPVAPDSEEGETVTVH